MGTKMTCTYINIHTYIYVDTETTFGYSRWSVCAGGRCTDVPFAATFFTVGRISSLLAVV